jgi:hypothetical protein
MRGAALLAACAVAGCDPGGAGRVLESPGLVIEGVLASPSGDAFTLRLDDKQARGEWWPCEGRLTTSACVGDRHVEIILARPNVEDFFAAGAKNCVANGVAEGAFESAQFAFSFRDAQRVPEDMRVFVVLASDKNDNAKADLLDEAGTPTENEVGALDALAGTLTVDRLDGFEGSFAAHFEGKSSNGALAFSFFGEMRTAETVLPVQQASTCTQAQPTE